MNLKKKTYLVCCKPHAHQLTIIWGSLPFELDIEVSGVINHGCVKQVIDGIGLPGAQNDILVCGSRGRAHLQCFIILAT